MPKPTNRAEIRSYADQVAEALGEVGIPVSHVEMDTPELAKELGREWVGVEIQRDWSTGLHADLVWNSHPDEGPLSGAGWLISTRAHHYPVRPDGEVNPEPKAVAKEVAHLLELLRLGRWVRHLPSS